MRELWNTLKALFVCSGIFVLFCLCLHWCGILAGCSPVNVQVQNCQNEVRDASGVTFTGCKADGDAKSDGTLRVNLDSPTEAPSESRLPPNHPAHYARLN